MKLKFTTLRLQADDRGLIVLQLNEPTTLRVQSASVWLTHSQSNQDYILRQGATLSMVEGTVLIESAQVGDVAVVEVHERPKSAFKRVVGHIQNDLLHTKVKRAVCVYT